MKYDVDCVYILQLCLSTGVWANVTGEVFVPADEQALESMVEIMKKTYLQTNYNGSKYRLARYNLVGTLEF